MIYGSAIGRFWLVFGVRLVRLVRLAGSAARLEAKSQRVTELEAQLAELKEEIEGVRQLAAELKIKAEEAGFSPLEALAHLDKAVDFIGRATERFKDK